MSLTHFQADIQKDVTKQSMLFQTVLRQIEYKNRFATRALNELPI